ncbi:MAG TPA: TonB-dependent receptor [Steroidobacteraceae bacterium]
MSSRGFAPALAAAAIFLNAASMAEPAAPAFANDAGGLEEVVVTAQRRTESAQSIGIALTVLTGSDLAGKAISHVDDLQNAVPSLQVEPAFGSGLPQYRIRGVGFLDYTSNNASPVGVSLDDVAFALPIQSQGQLFDIDRIEVLRGPQGTLYGRNTTGGEINFITNRPTAETHAGVTAEYGSHNEFMAEAFLSGTLLDNLTGRLSVATEQGGAWQRDRLSGASLGAKDKVAVRAQLEFAPSEAVDFRLVGHFADDKSDATGLHLIAPYSPFNGGAGGPTISADTSRYVTGWRLNPVFANAAGLGADSKPGLDNSNDGVDLTGNIGLGFAKIVSVTAYNKMIRREYGDWDATQYDDSDEYFRSNLDVFSQELRLQSDGNGPLGWVAGVFYSNQNLTEQFYSDFSDANIGLPAGTEIVQTQYQQHVNSIGEFGQVSYKFNDQFNAVFGVREDHETRELKGLNTGVLVGFPIPSFTGTDGLNASTTSNLPSGKVELDYTPIAGTLLYASVSRGVKSGGFTAHNTTNAGQIDPFEPEKLLAYEVGAKADVTNTLRINASAFLYRYKDQQILGKVLDAASGSYIGRFVNANSRIAGGELELQWRPVQGLSVSQYAGYTVGYFASYLPNSDTPPVDYDGKAESIPKWSYGGDASYAFDVGNFKVTAESNYSFHDTYSQFYLLGSNDFTVPRYWLANANLSLSPAAGAPWTFTVWGRNIFNRSYDVTRNFFLPSAEIAQAGEPATFGIRVSYRY